MEDFMKTIRELYREGRYNLWDKNRTAIERYKIDERLEEFMKSLTPKDRRILDEIIDDMLVKADSEAENTFSEGFSLGVRLTAESFESNKRRK